MGKDNDKIVSFDREKQINLHKTNSSYSVSNEVDVDDDNFNRKNNNNLADKLPEIAMFSSSGGGDQQSAAAAKMEESDKNKQSSNKKTKKSISCCGRQSRNSPSQSSSNSLLSHKKHQRRKKIKQFYNQQKQLINSYAEDNDIMQKFEKLESADNPNPVIEEDVARDRRVLLIDRYLSIITLVCNLLLLVMKVIAVAFSGSLSVISSLIDSLVDLTSGAVIYLTNRAIQKRDLWRFPRGRTRLEPLAIVIVAIIMGIASVQVVIEAIRTLISGEIETNVDDVTVSLMCVSIAVKVALLIACYRFKTINTMVLAKDQRNDSISITVAIICAYIGAHLWKYADPIGAILVSVSIAVNWILTGWRQIPVLSGHVARRRHISRILKLTLDHDRRIRQVDSIYAYYYATKFLVELDIVLDKTMSLKQAHDISERLQRKIEHLPFVERCFVHCDYESRQRPDMEHKIV